MGSSPSKSDAQPPIARPESHRSHVGPIELFFDLVYVFAIIQLSHLVLGDLSWRGAAQSTVVFLAVWWAWNYTAWAMNWLNPANLSVRLLNAFLMVASFGMALAVPYAFGTGALVFAGCYVAAQLGRASFMTWAFRGQQVGQNYKSLLAWSSLASVFWIAGALLPAHWQFWVWLFAAAVDYAAPRVGYRFPIVGGAPMENWDTNAEHLAERNQLVYIIALGESILLMGYTLNSNATYTWATLAVVLMGFWGLYVQWWSYFALHESDTMAGAGAGTGALRSAFAYAHALMVAGAIMIAVSIELRLTYDHTDTVLILVTIGGPVLYIMGNVLFLRSNRGKLAVSRYIAVGALLVLALGSLPLQGQLHPYLVGSAVLIVMTALAAYTQRTSGSRNLQLPHSEARTP